MTKTILIAGILMGSQMALAHANHAPKIALCKASECTKEEIEASVPAAVATLAEGGKIENTWTSAKIEGVEQKKFKKGSEWVATLLDENQKDQSKQRRYIFFTTKGALNGSNMTGQ